MPFSLSNILALLTWDSETEKNKEVLEIVHELGANVNNVMIKA